MKTLRYGIEIETVGLNRERLARAIQTVVGGDAVDEQYAAVELFRGTMVRHSAVVHRRAQPSRRAVNFEGDAWPGYVPVRLPDTVMVQEKLPPGAAAVVLNKSHSYTDIYLPLDTHQKTLFDAVDGKRTIGEIAPQAAERHAARVMFEGLWWYDQIVFDTSRPSGREVDGAPRS